MTEQTSGRLPNLVLQGFMGTGKSTLGPILAKRLQWEFIDTDSMVEQDAGMTIREIFARYGEGAFRALEREACLRAASRAFCVIATGGGALLDPESRAAMEASGVVILLTCQPEVLVSRLVESAGRGKRPLLAENFEARVSELLQIREGFYSNIPLKVDTTHTRPEEAADLVMQLYGLAAQDWVSACTI